MAARAPEAGGGSSVEHDGEQFLRTCKLIVSDNNTNGLDLSNLRIKFSVKQSITMTPNMADIRVYNLDEQTAIAIKKEFKKVILQAGYATNFGVVFKGNIKQVLIGRESAVDTFIDIIAGDGDMAYNFAVVNETLAAGSTQLDQVNSATKAMSKKGVTAGHVGDFPNDKLPRGKVMYGPAKNYLRTIAQSTDKSWSIQNEKITFVSNTSYLPGDAVVLTSLTGMIGTPVQTNDGVNVKCLLNPIINVGRRIKLDNSKIEQQKLNLEQIALAKGDVKAINNLIPRRLNPDGMYYVLVLEHKGDTRGIDWYSSLVCLSMDQSANPANSVIGANG